MPCSQCGHWVMDEYLIWRRFDFYGSDAPEETIRRLSRPKQLSARANHFYSHQRQVRRMRGDFIERIYHLALYDGRWWFFFCRACKHADEDLINWCIDYNGCSCSDEELDDCVEASKPMKSDS